MKIGQYCGFCGSVPLCEYGEACPKWGYEELVIVDGKVPTKIENGQIKDLSEEEIKYVKEVLNFIILN
jgi:hypothetical protein